MKKWNLKVKSNVQEISKKLNATLGTSKGFIFQTENSKNDAVSFKIHKRGLYVFNLMFLNKVIVNGKILKSKTKNETHLEISFTQYILWKLAIFTSLFIGFVYLIATISGISKNSLLILPAIIVLAAGALLLFAVQKKFEKDTEAYKTLISKILES